MSVSIAETMIPTEEEAAEAAEALSALGVFLRARPTPFRHVRIRPADGDVEAQIVVPAAAFRLFTEILAQMAEGRMATVVPVHAELTTQEAAEFLNVSRPYVVKLLEEDRIPFRKVGNRRRIRFTDLMAFKRQDDAHRSEVAAQLSDEAQKLGLGY